MNNKERKMSDKGTSERIWASPEFKFWTIVVLLLVIIYFQASCYFGARRMKHFMGKRSDASHSAVLKSGKEVFENDKNMAEQRRWKERQLDKKNDEIRSEPEHREDDNFDRQIDRTNKQKIQRRGTFVFRPKVTYREEEKEFVVIFRTPRNLTLEDINVKFVDNVLNIHIEKSQSADGSFSYESLSQAFTTPNTAATINDVKTVLDSGRVSVTVPIK
jgi:HSP20 family molecular chaperone IbpA